MLVLIFSFYFQVFSLSFIFFTAGSRVVPDPIATHRIYTSHWVSGAMAVTKTSSTKMRGIDFLLNLYGLRLEM